MLVLYEELPLLQFLGPIHYIIPYCVDEAERDGSFIPNVEPFFTKINS